MCSLWLAYFLRVCKKTPDLTSGPSTGPKLYMPEFLLLVSFLLTIALATDMATAVLTTRP